MAADCMEATKLRRALASAKLCATRGNACLRLARSEEPQDLRRYTGSASSIGEFAAGGGGRVLAKTVEGVGANIKHCVESRWPSHPMTTHLSSTPSRISRVHDASCAQWYGASTGQVVRAFTFTFQFKKAGTRWLDTRLTSAFGTAVGLRIDGPSNMTPMQHSGVAAVQMRYIYR